MSDQPQKPNDIPPPPSLPSAEELAEKIQREEFEKLLDDPVKLSEAQERLAEEIAKIRKNVPSEELSDVVPIMRMIGSAAVCLAIYIGLFKIGNVKEKGAQGGLMELGLAAFSPFFIVLGFVLAGLVVSRGSKMPVVIASVTGLITGVAIVVAQFALGVPPDKSQLLWILSAVAFFALGSLGNAVGRQE